MLLTNAEIDAAVELSSHSQSPIHQTSIPITIYRAGRGADSAAPVLHFDHADDADPPPPPLISQQLPIRKPTFAAPKVPAGIPLAGAAASSVRAPPPPIAPAASTLFVGDSPKGSFSPPVPRAARGRVPPPDIRRPPHDPTSLRNRGTTNFGVLLDDTATAAAAARANAASLIADDSDHEDNGPLSGRDESDNRSADGGDDDDDDELDPPPPPPGADSDAGSNQYVSTSMLLNAAAAAASSRPMYAEFRPLAHQQPEYHALTPAEELAPPTPIARLTATRSAPGVSRAAFPAPLSPVLSPTLSPPSSNAPNRPAPPRRTATRAPQQQQQQQQQPPPPLQSQATLPHQRPGANAPDVPRRARTLVREMAPGIAPVPKKQSFILGARNNAAAPPPPPLLMRKAASDVSELASDGEADPPPPPPPPDSPTIGAPPVRRRSQVTYENLPIPHRNQTYVQLGPEGIKPLPPTTTTTYAAVASLPVAQRKPAPATGAAAPSQYGSVTALAAPPASLNYVALSASEQIGRK